jgi:hypothetical protein
MWLINMVAFSMPMRKNCLVPICQCGLWYGVASWRVGKALVVFEYLDGRSNNTTYCEQVLEGVVKGFFEEM